MPRTKKTAKQNLKAKAKKKTKNDIARKRQESSSSSSSEAAAEEIESSSSDEEFERRMQERQQQRVEQAEQRKVELKEEWEEQKRQWKQDKIDKEEARVKKAIDMQKRPRWAGKLDLDSSDLEHLGMDDRGVLLSGAERLKWWREEVMARLRHLHDNRDPSAKIVFPGMTKSARWWIHDRCDEKPFSFSHFSEGRGRGGRFLTIMNNPRFECSAAGCGKTRLTYSHVRECNSCHKKYCGRRVHCINLNSSSSSSRQQPDLCYDKLPQCEACRARCCCRKKTVCCDKMVCGSCFGRSSESAGQQCRACQKDAKEKALATERKELAQKRLADKEQATAAAAAERDAQVHDAVLLRPHFVNKDIYGKLRSNKYKGAFRSMAGQIQNDSGNVSSPSGATSSSAIRPPGAIGIHHN